MGLRPRPRSTGCTQEMSHIPGGKGRIALQRRASAANQGRAMRLHSWTSDHHMEQAAVRSRTSPPSTLGVSDMPKLPQSMARGEEVWPRTSGCCVWGYLCRVGALPLLVVDVDHGIWRNMATREARKGKKEFATGGREGCEVMSGTAGPRVARLGWKPSVRRRRYVCERQ